MKTTLVKDYDDCKGRKLMRRATPPAKRKALAIISGE